MVSSDHLVPGERGEIRAKVDTRGKKGRVSKAIYVFSNDPKRPTVSLTLMMKVVDPFHSQKFEPKEIFKQPCSGCHVDRGKGKLGAELFNASCLICHRSGKMSSNLTKLRTMPDEALRSAIYSGVPKTQMPGFSWNEGGPLNKEEIDSLIRYIRGR